MELSKQEMELFLLQEHSRAMHHASSRGHPSASRFLVYVPQVYVPLDNLSDSVYKKSARSDSTKPVLNKSSENVSDFPAMPSLSYIRIRSDQPQTKYFLTGWGGEGGYKIIICEGIFEEEKTFFIFEFCLKIKVSEQF